MLEQFDLFACILGVAGQVHRCRFDLRCRCQAALNIDLESLDEIEKFVDRRLCRDELRLKQFKVPYLLVLLSCWYVLINLR